MTKILFTAATLIVLSIGPAPSSAEPPPELGAAEGATVHAIATTLEALEDWIAQQDSCPLEPGLQTLESIRPLLPAELRNRVVLQDGWTHPFYGWCNGDGRWALISYGADGEPGADYALLPALGDAGDDFVVLDGNLASAPGSILTLQQFGKQKRSMVDLRSIAIVFESYHLDNNAFPGTPNAGMQAVDGILSAVQPVYIRKLPLTDGWGHALLYWTDGVEAYRIASPGRDGIFEADYTASPGLGPFDAGDFDRDIVFGDGQFEQWPEQSPEE